MRVALHTIASDEAGRKARERLLSRRGEPLFFADWQRPVFLHYEVDPVALQREVPFPLDLREGRAYVSLVAFRMHRMRLRFGGRFGAWLCKPIGTHNFLNARTYVRHGGESGIFFLREWLSCPLCVCLGPLTFGLPYRLGRMTYQHHHESGNFSGSISAARGNGSLTYEARMEPAAEFAVCSADSLDEFLLERYTAFTSWRGKRRYFRIWHEPWLQASVQADVSEISLVTNVWPWFADATLSAAGCSPGVENVWMGWPHGISTPAFVPTGSEA